jgi:hypothetical protein
MQAFDLPLTALNNAPLDGQFAAGAVFDDLVGENIGASATRAE